MSRQQKKSDDELHSTIKLIITKLCTSDEFVSELSNSIYSLLSKQFNEKFKLIEDDNKQLCERIVKLEESSNKLLEMNSRYEQSLRKNNLMIYGITEDVNENCMDLSISVINTKLKLNLLPSDIESCYRVGKNIGSKTRDIKMKFYKNYHKNLVYGSKKMFKGTRVIVREDLSPELSNILKLVIGKAGAAGKVWTSNGTIYMKSENDDSIHKFSRLLDVQNL